MSKLPNPKENGTGPRTSNLPEPQGGSFNPFLKPEVLGKSGKGSVTIIQLRDAPPQSFSDLVVEVKVGTAKFDWGMKLDSGNYRRLFDRFGSNPRKWAGKKVSVETMEYAGKKYVGVVD